MGAARTGLTVVLAALVAAVGAEAAGNGTPACFGAASRDPQRPCRNPRLDHTVRPSPRAALDAPNAPCEAVAPDAWPSRCTFGSPAENARDTVALIGDSHATHWRSAMLTVAERRHWQGISITRSSCPFTRAIPDVSDQAGCVDWNRAVLDYLRARPEISTVVLGQHRGHVVAPRGADERRVQIRGYRRAWAALPPSVRHVVVIRDTPYQRTHTATCIEQARRRRLDIGRVCAVPRRAALKTDPAALAARRGADPRVGLVDLTPFFCDADLCFPVIGGALVHKDTTHMSLTYGMTLGPYLLRAVDGLLGR